MVLKVGGSIMYDQLLNVNFDLFKRIKEWYYKNKEDYKKIVFVTGGGGLSRNMQKRIADNIGGIDNLHGIAMSLTQANANIFASYLEDDFFIPSKLGDAYENFVNGDDRNVVTGGLKIGWSTDMVAAVAADVLEVKRVHKISNVDYVYNKDPKEFFDAKPIKDMTWEDFFKTFNISPGQQHEPNKNTPIDVGCVQYCARKGLSFFISGGKTLDEVDTIAEVLETGSFVHP